MRRALILLSIFAGATLSVCAAQSVLHETSTRSTDIPAFSFVGPAQCDDLNDTFFLVDGSPSDQGGSVVVRLDSKDVPYVYHIPESQNARLVRYYVDSQTGALTLVTQTAIGTSLVNFDRSGHQTAKTVMNLPAGLVVDAIASDRKSLLVAGFIDGTALAQDRMRTFVGLFDAVTGQTRGSISYLSGRPITPDDLHRPRDLAAIADGPYFYVASFGAVARVDINGTVQRIVLPRPTAAAAVNSITSFGRTLTFQFATPHPKGEPTQPLEFDVVDTATMQVTKRVNSSPELGKIMICAKDQYVFLRSVNGRLKFITAAPQS
jgi:hypothetical protein